MIFRILHKVFEKKTRISSIFSLLFVLNLLNLALGLISNTALAARFGAGTLKDGIELALSTSRNMVTTFGIGSLGGSALYVVARLSAKGRGEIDSYVSSVFVLQLAYSLVFFLALRFFAVPIVAAMSPGMSPAIQQLAVGSVSWAAWVILLQPVADLLGAANTGLQIYGTIQIGTLIQKLCLVGGILATGLWGPVAYPAGNTIGLLLSIVLLAAVLMRTGFRFTSRISLRSTEIRESLKLSVPWVLASPLLNVANWIIVPVMIGLGPGNYSSFLYANVLYTMVIAVVITPFSDGLSPQLARHAGVHSDGKDEGRALISLGYRVSIMLGILVAALSVGGSKPLVGLILYRGAMDAHSAQQISQLFAVSGGGLAAQAVTIFLSRLFQARISMTGYIVSQLVGPLIMLPLVFLLVGRIGIHAVAVATSVSSFFGGWISWVMARRLVGRELLVLDRNLTVWGMTVVTAAVGIAWIPVGVVHGLAVNALRLVAVSVALGSLAWLVSYLLRLPECLALNRLVAERLFRGAIAKINV